jgi:predicted DNA-binding transcriptional regulator AlpA
MWAPTNRHGRRRLNSKRGRRLIGKVEVIARIGLSYQTIWKLMVEGRFPRSIVLAGKVMWFEDEIDVFIASLPRRVLKNDKRQTLVRVVNHVTRRRARSNQTEETTT